MDINMIDYGYQRIIDMSKIIYKFVNNKHPF